MLVSIVITVYNVAEWLEQSVKSAFDQTYNDIEVIIVEDCSTDDGKTADVIKKLQVTYPSLIVVRNEKNLGAGMSRRIGIEHSKGDYVELLDGDDWIDRDFIQSLLREGKNADIICGGVTLEYPDGHNEVKMYQCMEERDPFVKELLHFREAVSFMNNKLVKRSLYEKVPYSSRRFIEDTPTMIPIFHISDNIVYVENAGYHYRQRDDSIMGSLDDVRKFLFMGLCSKDILEFLSTTPCKGKSLFGNNMIVSFGKKILDSFGEDIKATRDAYPDEYREFMEYYNDVVTTKDKVKLVV